MFIILQKTVWNCYIKTIIVIMVFLGTNHVLEGDYMEKLLFTSFVNKRILAIAKREWFCQFEEKRLTTVATITYDDCTLYQVKLL